MIEIKLGYDTIYDEFGEVNPYGSAQWCTFYIEDDFSSFLDSDGEKYYRNELAPVGYSSKVQEMRESFLVKFNDLNCIDDLDNVDGVLSAEELIPSLPY